MGDLKKIFQYFAKQDVRLQPQFRPSCLDPLGMQGELSIHLTEKAEALAKYFANKLPTCGSLARGGG